MAFANTVERRLNEKLGEFASILDWGVERVGSTGAATKINLAINDVVDTYGGGTLYFPAGEYVVNQPIVAKSKVRLYLDAKAVIRRGANMPVGKGVIDIDASDFSIEGNGEIDGAVTTVITTLDPSDSTPDHERPGQNERTLNTSVWIHGGSERIRIQGITIRRSGGYIIFGDARTADISDLEISGCRFLDQFGTVHGAPGSRIYGGWSGVFFHGNGSTFAVRGASIRNNEWSGMTGHAFWSWAPGFNAWHTNIQVSDNRFRNIGLDAILVGNTLGAVVSGNKGSHIGRFRMSPTDPFLWKWNPVAARYAVAIDTSGARAYTVTGNSFEHVNGEDWNGDGAVDNIVTGNSFWNALPGDPEYASEGYSSMGPAGAGPATKGMSVAANFFQGVTPGLTLSNNLVQGTYSAALSITGVPFVRVIGNEFHHSPTASGPPVLIENAGGRVSHSCQFEGNMYRWGVPGQAIIYEDEQYGGFGGQANFYSHDEIVITGEQLLRRAPDSGSIVGAWFHSNQSGLGGSNRTLLQRDGAGSSAAYRLRSVTGNYNHVMATLFDYANPTTLGPGWNVSRDGLPNTGVMTTGDALPPWGLQDSMITRHHFARGFFAIGADGFAAAAANSLDSSWSLIRKGTNGLEQSVTVSGGARIWTPLGGSSIQNYLQLFQAGQPSLIDFQSSGSVAETPDYSFRIIRWQDTQFGGVAQLLQTGPGGIDYYTDAGPHRFLTNAQEALVISGDRSVQIRTFLQVQGSAFNALDLTGADAGLQAYRTTFVQMGAAPSSVSGKGVIYFRDGQFRYKEGTGVEKSFGASVSIPHFLELYLSGSPTGIDFHSQDGTDYEARIWRDWGQNSAFEILQTGTGQMRLLSTSTIRLAGATLEFSAGTFPNNVESSYSAAGVLQIGGFVNGAWRGAVSAQSDAFNAIYARGGADLLSVGLRSNQFNSLSSDGGLRTSLGVWLGSNAANSNVIDQFRNFTGRQLTIQDGAVNDVVIGPDAIFRGRGIDLANAYGIAAGGFNPKTSEGQFFGHTISGNVWVEHKLFADIDGTIPAGVIYLRMKRGIHVAN
jgi:hypothetical protein